MASVTAKEIPEVQCFFTELWNLYKKYYIPEPQDEYWNAVVREFTELSQKYANVSIADKFITIVLDDLENKYEGGVKRIEKQ